MENENSKSMITAVVAVLILIGGGIGIYALTQNDDDTNEVTSSEVQQTEPTEVTNDASGEEPEPNVIEAAQATPQLSTLVDAVIAANLVETLSGEGPFTVFAPTNDAFAALIEELDTTAEELLARDDLATILTYHVVAAEVFSTDLTDGQVITTVQGEDLTVSIADGIVTLTDTTGRTATVTAADIDVSNGVIHLIDTVVLPTL